MEKIKKVLALILVFLFMCALGGCNSAGQNTDLPEENVQTAEELYFELDAYTLAGGMLKVTMADGTVEETGGYGLSAKAGQTFGEALADSGIKSVEPILEGDTFEGWIIFENCVTVDEDGFESYTYELRSGDTRYTTQELLELAVPEYMSTVVAKWEGTPEESYFADEDYMWEAGVTTGAFALSANGGTMVFQPSDGDEAYDNPTYTYWMEDGQALAEVMVQEQWDVLTEVKKDNAQFDGWTVYEADSVTWDSTPVNEGGTVSLPFDDRYEGFEYIVMENAKQYDDGMTTQELCQIINYSRYYVAVANWK